MEIKGTGKPGTDPRVSETCSSFLHETHFRGLKLLMAKSTPTKHKPPESPQKWWVIGSPQMCEFFSISAQTLSVWIKKGCPQEERGKYDLIKIIQWKYGHNNESSSEVRKLKAEADWKEAKAGQEAIKLAVAEGKYLATEDVTKDLKRLFTVLRRQLLAIGHSVAIELNVFDAEAALAAKKVIDDAIYNALAQLAETDKE